MKRMWMREKRQSQKFKAEDARVIRLHALSVRVGRAIKHLVGDGGLSMRVVPRI